MGETKAFRAAEGTVEITFYPSTIGIDAILDRVPLAAILDREPLAGVYQDMDHDTARKLAEFILENLPKPDQPSAREIFDSLPVGGRFTLDGGNVVRIKVGDTTYYNPVWDLVFDVENTLSGRTQIEVVE